MAFMDLEIIQKGALYCADCTKCGTTMYTHEWAMHDHNDLRDAMQEGTAICDYCGGRADSDTFAPCGRQYAARYSASGYLDCTEWSFDKNKRRLARDVRAMYGE